jgi:hypothetical protein
MYCRAAAAVFMAEAKSRCPALIVVPYEFEKYEEVSEQVSVWADASQMFRVHVPGTRNADDCSGSVWDVDGESLR